MIAGRALERLGRDGEALLRYEATLASRPALTEALDGAIALLRRLGRNEEIACWSTMASLDPPEIPP